jgi:hypothetical protein
LAYGTGDDAGECIGDLIILEESILLSSPRGGDLPFLEAEALLLKDVELDVSMMAGRSVVSSLKVPD